MKPEQITRKTRAEDLPEMLTAPEAAAWLGISRGLAFELCRRGDLRSVRLGRLLRIPRSAVQRMLNGDRS